MLIYMYPFIYMTLHYITLHCITLHCITLHTYIHTYINTCMHACTYIYTYIHASTHTYFVLFTYLHFFTCLCNIRVHVPGSWSFLPWYGPLHTHTHTCTKLKHFPVGWFSWICSILSRSKTPSIKILRFKVSSWRSNASTGGLSDHLFLHLGIARLLQVEKQQVLYVLLQK